MYFAYVWHSLGEFLFFVVGNMPFACMDGIVRCHT